MSDTPAQDAPPAEDPAVEEALRACIAHHEGGRLAEARAGLETVLAGHPDNANALHLLGLVRFAQGDSEAGASLVGRALAQAPEFSVAAGNLATVIRAWIDRAAIADALGLTHDQQVLLSQTVGYPRPQA